MFGLLNVNKPRSWTSRDVVNRVVRLVPRQTRAGHAGTLDPLATGVLVVCIGPATRLVPLIHHHPKQYRATFRLGLSSDTEDIEGTVRAVRISSSISETDVRAVIPEFVGEIAQVPPAYSAVKIKGEPAYRAARRGEQVEVPARRAHVHRINLLDFHFPDFSLEIECGTGTYIRSLGRDLARRLGTEAVMTELVRTRVGSFSIEDSVPIELLDRDSLHQHLRSPLTMLQHLPRIVIQGDQVQRLSTGQALEFPSEFPLPQRSADPIVVTTTDGHLLAIAREQQGRLAPQIVFPSEQVAGRSE